MARKKTHPLGNHHEVHMQHHQAAKNVIRTHEGIVELMHKIMMKEKRTAVVDGEMIGRSEEVMQRLLEPLKKRNAGSSAKAVMVLARQISLARSSLPRK